MSGIIPKGHHASYQPWQLNSFDSKPVPADIPPATPIVEETPAEMQGEPVSDFPLPSAEDIERIYEEARTSGYAAGLEEGKAAGEEAGKAVAQQKIEHIDALVGNIEKSLGELDQTVADQILELALEVASQLARGAIEVDRDFLLPTIKEAIASLPLHHAHVSLQLNPADSAKLRDSLSEQFGQGGLQIIDNADITEGGCRLTAGASDVDASIETRWNRVLEAIGAEPRKWLKQNT